LCIQRPWLWYCERFIEEKGKKPGYMGEDFEEVSKIESIELEIEVNKDFEGLL